MEWPGLDDDAWAYWFEQETAGIEVTQASARFHQGVMRKIRRRYPFRFLYRRIRCRLLPWLPFW